MDGVPSAAAACPSRSRFIPSYIARAMSSVTPRPRLERQGSAVATRESSCWFAYPTGQLVQPRGVAGPGGGPGSDPPPRSEASTSSGCWFRSPVAVPPITSAASECADPCAVSSDSAHEAASGSEASIDDSDSEVEDDEDEGEECAAESSAVAHAQPGKLWGPAQFPEGNDSTYRCWDWANILAAHEWCCPHHYV